MRITYCRDILKASAAGVLCILFSCSTPDGYMINVPRSTESEIPVRILLSRSDAPVSVSSSGEIIIHSKRSGELLHRSLGKTIKFAPERMSERVTVEASSGLLHVNDAPYRGVMEIHPSGESILVINELKLDEYLLSVVPSEIPSSWPLEALKAQAVAARTYTIYHLKNTRSAGPYDLDATTKFQVYRGVSAENERTTEAVLSTSGKIISADGVPICAYFHSTCGGRTANDSDVWKGIDLGYLEGVECGYCADSPSAEWTVELGLNEIHSAVSSKFGRIGKIKRITFHKESGRVTDVIVVHDSGSISIPGNSFRLLFPGNRIKSLYMDCEKNDNGLLVRGRGWGHGVGLCQYGARGMAEKGRSYRDILKHYYSSVDIIPLARHPETYLANY